MTIASNEFKDRYRKKMRHAVHIRNYRNAESMKLEMENIPSLKPTANQLLEDEEIKNQLREEIRHLKWKLKSVVVLHYFEDKPLEEVSRILNIPIGTVKSRLSQARKTLKGKLEVMI